MNRTLIVATFFAAAVSLAAFPAGAQERRPHASSGNEATVASKTRPGTT
jgi:hypothetical protein